MGVGYLVGGFDLLDVGHLDVIAQARERCGRLVVGVLTDDHVLRTTGLPPVVPLHERVALLQHVRGVGAVVVHGSDHLSGASPHACFVIVGELIDGLAGAVALEARRPTRSAVLSGLRRRAAGEAVA